MAGTAVRLPFTNPTPADIKLDFVAFAAVDDVVIQRRIDRALMYVDETWLETDFTWAKELLTVHWLKKAGYPSGSSDELSGMVSKGLSRLKSADLDITVSSKVVDASISGEFSSTSEGQEFYRLLRKNKGGAYVAAGSSGCIGPQSTDMPFAWSFNGACL